MLCQSLYPAGSPDRKERTSASNAAGERFPPLSTSFHVLSGYRIANIIAMFAPSEKPRISAFAMPWRSKNPRRSSANCLIVKGAVPLGVRPCPRVSSAMTLKYPPLVRSHGISLRSFLVYPPNLRIRVTIAILDFVTLRPLIRRIRLNIGFLFVRLRFCYPFLSPTPHDVNLGSRFGVRR